MACLSVGAKLDSMKSRQRLWKTHGGVLGAMGVLLLGLNLVIWVHPRIGFAQGGILNGADLRSALIQICWWMFLAFAVASTLTLGALATIRRGPVIWTVAYTLGVVAALGALPIIDRFF